MNEEAIKDAYQLFVNNGYSKSVEEFKVLMRENENARKDMFDLFVSEGYKKKPEDFNLLMGVGQVKKKVNSKVTSREEGTDSPTEQVVEEPISVESSAQVNNGLSESESSEALDFIKNMQRAEAPASDAPTKRESSGSSPKRIKLTPSTKDLQEQNVDIESTEGREFLKEGGSKFLNKEDDPTWQKKVEEKQVSEEEEDAAAVKLEEDIKAVRTAKLTEEDKEVKRAEIDSAIESGNDPFTRGMKYVKSFLLKNEEHSVADLNKVFNQYGYKFTEELGGRNAIGIESANGQKITVDYGTSAVSKKGTENIINSAVTDIWHFMSKHRVESELIEDKVHGFKEKRTNILISEGVRSPEKRKLYADILTEKDLNERTSLVNTKLDGLQSQYDDYEKLRIELESSDPKTQEEVDSYNLSAEKLNNIAAELKTKYSDVQSIKSEHDELVGRYTHYQAEKWDLGSISVQSILTGFVGIGEGVSGHKADFKEALLKAGMSIYGNYKGFSDKEMEAVNSVITTQGNIERDMIINGANRLKKDMEYFGTTLEAIDRIKEESFVGAALLGSLESVAPMLLNIVPGAGSSLTLGGFYMQGYGGKEKLLRQYKGYDDLGIFEKITIKTLTSAAGALLEKAGFDNAFTSTGMINKLISKTLKDLPKEASEIAIFSALKRNAIQLFKKVGSGTAGEGLTGGIQEISDISITAIYNTIKDKDVFKNPKSVGAFVERVFEASASEAIGGFAMTLPGSVYKSLKKGKTMDLPNDVFEMFSAMTKDEGFAKLFSQDLKIKMSRGEITQEQAQEQLDNFHTSKSTLSQIPKNYTTDQTKEAAYLLLRKKDLEQEMSGKSPELVGDKKSEIDEINERLKTISSKTETEYANEKIEILEANKEAISNMPMEKDTKIAIEKAIDDEVSEIKKRLNKPKTLIDKVKGVFSKKEKSPIDEIDNEIKLLEENRSKELKEIDDKKFDDTLDLVTDENGKTYRNTKARQKKAEQDRINKVYDDKVEALKSKPTQQTNEVEAKKADIERRREEEKDNATIININGQIQEEDSLNEIYYQATKELEVEARNNLTSKEYKKASAILNMARKNGWSIQEIKDKLSKEFNVKFSGGMFGVSYNAKVNQINAKYDAELAALESAQQTSEVEVKKPVSKKIEKKPVESEAEKKEMSVDEQVDLLTNILEGKTPVEETKALPRKQIDNQVDNAKKALSKVAPEVEIIVSESEAEYKKATKEGRNQSTGGRYVDGKIYINPNRANKRTVAHEVFHALLLSKGRTDQQAQAITERMMEAVKKNADQELIDRLEKFSSNYKKALESEESIAELIGILADGYPQLNAEAKSLIKRWLDRLAKIFGLKPLTSDTDIINFLNTVSDKIASGKKIKSRDVKVLGDIDSEVKNLAGKTPNEIVNSVREQKGLINLSEQEVLKYARAGIENQYEAQAIKQIGLQGVTFTKEGIQGKVKEELDSFIKESDNYIMSEDSKAVDGAIQFEINTLINDGASEAQIENAKQAFQPGSMRDNFINKYKETQKETLDQWKSYLSESNYNNSFKYLILDAVLTNNYDFKTNKYTKRSNKTIRNYTPFDAGTLASLYASDSKSLLKDYVEIQAQNSKNVVESSSFVSTKEGEWLKFEGGPSVSNEVRVENANKLSQIVQNTYWCTKTNAKNQLDGGDFYVYATKNSEGEYESRVAVRMEGDKVGEVRGNDSSKQDLEPDMMPVADKFLKENIPNGSGKKWLDSIEYNTRVKELTEKIEGKKVTEQSLEEYLAIIKDSGKFKVDYGENGLVTKLKKVFDDSEFDFPVARNLRELRPDTVLFIGNFKPIEAVSSNIFPKYVTGYAYFGYSEVTDLGQLQSISGYADFGDSQVTDLGQLQSIGRDAYFGYSEVTDLGQLQSIGGNANFGGSKVTDLGQLQSIGVNANFRVSKVTDLGQLQSIGRDANFGYSKITDLGQLQSIGGNANFRDSQVTDLGQLQSIGRDADFGENLGLENKWNQRESGTTTTQSRQQNADKPSITEVRRIAKENGLKEEAVDKVLKNLGYTSAEISESIEIESEIERQSKKSIKRPKSAKKIIGKSKRDKVTVDEMSSLKTQIRLEAKAAKGAKTDLNQKRKNLAKIIKDFEKGKNITTAKSQTIINRISKVNLDNEVAVEKLLDYIAKQYGIAKVKEETSASNTKRERAKNNIKSKIGTAKDTFNIFKKLFSYDSGLITNEKLKKQYEDLLNRFGSSSAVLSVKDLKSEAKIAREIVEVMEKENAQFEDLADVFYENQVLDKDGSVDYKATMDILGKGTNPILVKDQLDVLEKYNKKLDLKKTKESLTPEQQQEEIDSLIDSAMKEKVTNKVTDNKYSRISAFKFIELMKDRKNLEGLTENQLKSLPLILENINNGIFTTRANTIMNALDVKGNSDVVTAQLNKAKALAIESIMRGLQTKVMFKSEKTSAYRQIYSNALKDIDTILGLKGKEIYNRTFKRMGSAFATFQEATREVNEKLTDINTKLYKKFTEENKVVEAKYRIQAYMLELEYESNPEMAKRGGVFKASEWIDETIKTLEDKGNQKHTIEILRKVKKQVEGKSAEEIKSGMTRVEKEAVNVINKINEETAEKALYVGSVVRGSRPDMINKYVHHDVMSSDKGRKAENAEISDHYDKTTNVKTKAGTVEGRTKGVKALNMDALNSTLRGAKQTLLDFHITNENRVVKKILSTVKENVESTSENTRENKVLKLAEISPGEFAVAMNEAYDEAMAIAFGSSFRTEGYLDKAISFGYQYKLAGVPRAFAEFSSNLGYAAIADPVSFGLGAKFIFQKNGLSDSIEFLTLSGSSELSRFTGAKNTGKSVDMLAKNVDLSKAEGRGALSNAVKTFSNKSGVKFVSGGAEVIADVLISTPDKAVSLPIWVGTFTSEMKKSNVDLEQFKNNADYRSEKAKEIEAARNKADQALNKAAGTQSIFGGVLKNKINKRDDGGLVQARKYVNGYLTNFLIFEYSTARDGIIGMMGNGEISRRKGAQLLTAATVRMASYGLLYKVFSSLIYGAFGAEDEDEDEIGVNEVTRAFVGAAASLFLGRNFGTIARRGLNIGVEYLNEEYGQSIRGDEEYDSFKHGLGLGYFNIKSDDLKDKDNIAYQVIKETTGPLSSHAVLILNMISAGAKVWNPSNDQEKEESIDYLLSQALIETAGLFTGKIPLIKDLKKYLFTIPTSNKFALKDKQYSYNELKDKNKIKFATEEEKFQSKPEIKEIDMNLNKVTRLIKGGTLSEENEIKAKQKQSTLKNDKKALKRAYMDEQFGFKDKKDIGKVSKNDNVNDKSIDEQMAEMEIIDERTYKEYKEEDERKYTKTLRRYKNNRTYRKSDNQKAKLTRKLKDAQRKKRDYLIPELKAKIKLIQQEMKDKKREFFNKAFKK